MADAGEAELAITSCQLIDSGWDDAWDALTASCPHTGFMQSSDWMAFKRLEGFITPRFGIFDASGTLRGGGACLFYPSHAQETMVICPQGPILPWAETEPSRHALRLLIAEVEKYVETHGGLGLRIEPRIARPVPRILRNWVRSPVDLDPEHSLVIDVGEPATEQSLLRAMHPKGRYNIKVAERHGVTVRRSTNMRDLRPFHAMFLDTSNRNGFFAEPYSFFVNMASMLFPVGMAELFMAEFDGALLSAAMVIRYGKRATFLYGASSAHNRHVMPTYAMHWNVIRAARAAGCTEYDLYGFDPYDQPDHAYAGFSRFKRQFGGRLFTAIGARDLVFYDRLADRIAEKLAQMED